MDGLVRFEDPICRLHDRSILYTYRTEMARNNGRYVASLTPRTVQSRAQSHQLPRAVSNLCLARRASSWAIVAIGRWVFYGVGGGNGNGSVTYPTYPLPLPEDILHLSRKRRILSSLYTTTYTDRQHHCAVHTHDI